MADGHSSGRQYLLRRPATSDDQNKLCNDTFNCSPVSLSIFPDNRSFTTKMSTLPNGPENSWKQIQCDAVATKSRTLKNLTGYSGGKQYEKGKRNQRHIPYQPVYNAHPCMICTPILECPLTKKRKQKTEEVVTQS